MKLLPPAVRTSTKQPPGWQVHLGIREGSQTLALNGGKAGPLVHSPLLQQLRLYSSAPLTQTRVFKDINCSAKDWPAEQPAVRAALPRKCPSNHRMGQCFLGKLVPVFKSTELELFGKTGNSQNSRQKVVVNESLEPYLIHWRLN